MAGIDGAEPDAVDMVVKHFNGEVIAVRHEPKVEAIEPEPAVVIPTTEASDTNLDFALDYAAKNKWHVFPVHPAPNKRPLCEHGFKDATTDPDRIKAMFKDNPDAQIGVACGASGIVMVDLDEKERISGRASLDQIGIDAATACNLIMQSQTPGAQQLFFSDKDQEFRRQCGVLPGVDILGDGGYTIVPSPSSPGRAWIVGDPFDEDDLEAAPDWVADQLDSKGGRPQQPTNGRTETLDVVGRKLHLDELQEIKGALDCIPNEDRGVWIKIGMALKSTGAGDQAYSIWVEWSQSSDKFDDQDQRYQWDRLHTLKMDGSEITLGTLF